MANRRLSDEEIDRRGQELYRDSIRSKVESDENVGKIISSDAMAIPAFELEEATIAGLQQAMAGGPCTARRLTELYLQRIDALNHQGPSLHAVIELNPDALDIANALDAERHSQGPRGPLHGIPILLKDNIDTHDRMATTAGSLALEGSIPAQDATVAARLRAAGAVFLGKANLSEWANFRGHKSHNGWSARGGQCRNPYVLDQDPSGSSSGSAVAAAANLCAAAIGTETDGSIISPASANAIVGIKPTVGLVSRAGIIPISASQDTAGPMARTVADAAALLGAMAGTDSRDPATAGAGDSYVADYTVFLDRNGLRGRQLGIVRYRFPDGEPGRLLEEALDLIKRSGAVLIDAVDARPPFEVPEWQLLEFEFKDGLNRYLAGLGPDAPVHSLEEVIQFNQQHAEQEMALFGQEVLIESQQKGPLEGPEFQEVLTTYRKHRSSGIDRALRAHGLDALVASASACSLAAMAGYPSLTMPAGYDRGMPVGILFFGPAWSEPLLIKTAYAFEQAAQARRPPKFLPTLLES